MDPRALQTIMRRHRVRLLLQFGSTVRRIVHLQSDVDLAVQRESAPDSLDGLIALITDLQTLFCDREVDVVEIHRADPLLLKKIAEECRLLYGTERRLHEFRIYAFKRYQDHRRYLEMERAYLDRFCSKPQP